MRKEPLPTFETEHARVIALDLANKFSDDVGKLLLRMLKLVDQDRERMMTSIAIVSGGISLTMNAMMILFQRIDPSVDLELTMMIMRQEYIAEMNGTKERRATGEIIAAAREDIRRLRAAG